MNGFSIDLIEENGKFLYERIYDYIKKEIREGKLLVGEKLPSTRSLAQYLEISRSTIELAYEQLLSEGYIEARPYRGYYVCKIEELYQITLNRELKKRNEEVPKISYKYDFSPYGIDMSSFPFSTWRKISRNVLDDDKKELFLLGEPKGDKELRETICKYLHSARGVNCEADQIIIGAGNDFLLMLLEKILAEKKIVAIENPTYLRAYKMFQSFQYDIKAIKMDKQGICMEELRKNVVNLAYIMPSHQFPTGVVMPIGRRMELLKWANEEENRFLIEDDYDSEFRYKGKPIPSLQASDHKGKVIYLGTFSKSIAPAIRVSYMVLPKALMDNYKNNCSFLSSTVSRIDQKILNDFIREGHYERHLNKMRKIYKNKHDLIIALLKPLDKEWSIFAHSAGLHLVLQFRGQKTEEELLALVKQVGIKIYGMSEFYVEDSKSPYPALIMGYGGLQEEEIISGVSAFLKAIKLK